MRGHLICYRAGSILLLALAAGCTAHAGPVAVLSSGLGYESSYAGARYAGTVEHGAFVATTEVLATDSNKLETGDGWGVSGLALAGYRIRSFALYAGARIAHQETSAWKRTDTAPVAAVEWFAPRRNGSVSLRYSAPDDSQYSTQSLALVGLFGRKVQGRVAYERAWFNAYGIDRHGSRVEVGVLFPIGGE